MNALSRFDFRLTEITYLHDVRPTPQLSQGPGQARQDTRGGARVGVHLRGQTASVPRAL